MTISKKLVCMATLGLGLNMPFIASAYDVVGLKEEVKTISEYAQNNWSCIEHNNRNVNISHWLERKLNSTYMTSSSDIIKIANIIKTYNATANLLAMEAIDHQKSEFRKESIKVIVATAYITVIALCAYDNFFHMLDTRDIHMLGKVQQMINSAPKKGLFS